ncbi:MAG: alpha/beta hydrolase-fold protein [Bacteroidales bacterium]|jgi:pimeloyl-ACP methyl ester carboxylesterase|nr:alpha/beta hydrolase-fold protein [Bacteroidales bacterium]
MKISIWLIGFGLFFLSCQSPQNRNENENRDKVNTHGEVAVPENYPLRISQDTLFELTNSRGFISKVAVKLPDVSTKACILLLHGWNLPANQWCDSTEFCNKALAQGYALLIPDFKLCNYPMKIHPECLPKYRKYPDLPWIMDTLIPEITNKTGLLDPSCPNFVAGISTGGRGATLLAYYMPEMFSACASLSGDFDITAMADEFLYKAWFGEYEAFPERWKSECFAYDAVNFRVPFYIAHGKADAVSPWQQSQAMADSLKTHHPELPIRTYFPDSAAHDYNFWGKQTDGMLEFFREFW